MTILAADPLDQENPPKLFSQRKGIDNCSELNKNVAYRPTEKDTLWKCGLEGLGRALLEKMPLEIGL